MGFRVFMRLEFVMIDAYYVGGIENCFEGRWQR